ncbi:MAG: chaperone protein HtpG [Candidatus Mesenet longicola]|uniref:Chaperone protein HtpG n=1 Tax=Candidatus Mesenet longicola TaxID=1892558 RepID=A0A8J3HYA2_9RICK|nr:MAG: chaperone protein HtpG [Candidatus Mesenet longicola]GHM59776.1 MAG: chaperone protein HtpG [Candidatus Mesenet longicola]
MNGVEEKLKFDAEVGKVLNIVIHSLYTNKDIFLRELISNASDACEKLRVSSITNPDLIGSQDELKITIKVDKENHRLCITDNGIGMNKQDLIDNLGTIASSGTQKFLDAVKNNKDSNQAVELIGKFGVGFYSAFMVAAEVVVRSRKAGEKESWLWKSKGDGEFTVRGLDEQLPRGTEITLFLHPKEQKLSSEEHEFLDKFRIEHIITTYSDHIAFPIEFVDENNNSEKLNSKSAIWTRAKNEITPEEHDEFFHKVAHVGGKPWMILHNKNEGTIEFTNLLYISSIKPFDLFHPDRRCSVKLYVNKVFITEDNVEIIPRYLRFLKGVVDSPDLPLNINRETLQNNKVIGTIRQSLVKKVISALKKRADEDLSDYAKFWDNFGAVLKEGLCEAMDTDGKEKLFSVCRFYSTAANDNNTLVSIEDYIKRMKPDQDNIYYLTGNDIETIKKSPQLEGFISRGLEVLLLVDPVDDFWTNLVTEYQKYKLKSITRVDTDLEKFSVQESDEGKKDEYSDENSEEEVDSLIKYFTKVLGDSVSSVKVSKKLTSSPVCLAAGESGMDIRMERFLREQKQLNYKSAKILEINIKHPVIKGIVKSYTKDGEGSMLEDIIHLLFNQACIIEGEEIGDTSAFSDRINNIFSKVL